MAGRQWRRWRLRCSYPSTRCAIRCKPTTQQRGKAEIRIAIKKHAKRNYVGDLIFTKSGVRGPVVLDLSREVSALLEKHDVSTLITSEGVHERHLTQEVLDRFGFAPFPSRSQNRILSGQRVYLVFKR